MESFTPVSATIGRLPIGASAVLPLALHSRLAGIDGILGGPLPGPAAGWTA